MCESGVGVGCVRVGVGYPLLGDSMIVSLSHR